MNSLRYRGSAHESIISKPSASSLLESDDDSIRTGSKLPHFETRVHNGFSGACNIRFDDKKSSVEGEVYTPNLFGLFWFINVLIECVKSGFKNIAAV